MSTNPNNAIGTNGAFGGRTSVNAFNDVLGVFKSRGIVSGWGIVPDSGMDVAVGGDGSTRDVAIAEDNIGNKTTVNNISQQPVTVSIPAAPASNSRIDLIVAYVDNPAQGVATETDNYGACGLIVVSGATAANPVAPDESDIRTAITTDGGAGSVAYYVVLGSVTVASGTTDITSNMISSGAFAAVKSDNVDYEIIYDGGSGGWAPTRGSTLATTVSPIGFRYIEIYAEEVGGRDIFAKMYDTSLNNRVNLVAFITGNAGAAESFCRNCVLTLTSTGFTCDANGSVSISTSNAVTQNTTSAAVRLKKVIGIPY